MAAEGISFAAVRRHFEARISHTAGLIQAPGVLVRAGTMRPQQQTFVKNAVWDPSMQRGSGGNQAAHIVAGGLYVVHGHGDPRFGSLLRQGYAEDTHGYLVTPIYQSAISPQGRHLISSQMTATTVLPAIVNRIELAAEGTRGNQLPLTAGEKTALEHGVSFVKTSAPGRALAEISCFAIEQTRQVCAAVARKLANKDAELRSVEHRSVSGQLEAIQLQRELIDLKLNVVRHPERALDRGSLYREATLLYEYEAQSEADRKSAIQETAESYKAEEGLGGFIGIRRGR
jgi:hypothetical protein